VAFPEGAWRNGVNGTEQEKAAVSAFQDRCRELDLPSEYNADPGGTWRLMRIPFNNDARSFTMDGEPAVGDKRLGRMPDAEAVGDVLLFHYPGTWNHFLADHTTSFRVLPLSATETMVTTTWLVPEDAVEGEDYTLENLTHVWKKTNEQDAMLVERNQVGVTSPAFEPGPYNTQHEDGTSSFVDWYCNAIGQQAAAAKLA